MPPVAIAVAAAAASYGAAAAAVGASLVAAGGFGAAIIGAMAASVVAAVGGAIMTKKPKSAELQMQDRTVTVRQPVAPRQVVYGTAKVGGTIIFMHSSDKNKYLHMVVALAGHEVAEIGDIYFDDKKLSLDADGYTTNGDFYYNVGSHLAAADKPRARVKKYLGTADQAADPDLIAASGGKWTANHRGRGVAYLYVRLTWDTTAYASGIPNITAVVKGKKVFDPRTGATAWSDNAALCIRDYLTTPAKDGGVGALASELDATNWTAAANLCDEDVPLTTGGTEKRYRLNGTISLAEENNPKNTLDGLLSSVGGYLVYAGGTWRLIAAAWRTPTVSLTESDCRDAISVQSRVSRRDSFNGVKGTFVSPANNWQPSDYPAVKSDAEMADQGGYRVYREIDRPYTTSAATAQRLGKIALLRMRQPLTVTMPCKLTAFRVQCGDVVNVTNARFGWTNKPFEVLEWNFAVSGDGALGVDLSLRETHGSIYDWATSEESRVDPAPNTTLPDWRNVAAPTQLAADSARTNVLTGSDGSLISRVVVTWTAANDAFVDKYEIQWRLTGGTAWTYEDETKGLTYAIDTIPVGVSIDIRVRALNSLGGTSDYAMITGHVVSGYSTTPNPAVTNLKVVGSAVGSPGTFNTRDVTFSWDATAIGLLFKEYVVEIRDAATNALRRSTTTQSPSYLYTFADNSVDGLARSFRVSVQVRTRLDALSTATVLTATNPAPALPTIEQVQGDWRTVSLRWRQSTVVEDHEGIRVWMSETAGFTPAPANRVYWGPETFVVVPAEPGKTYRLRWACYDAFAAIDGGVHTGLNLSGEQVVTTIRISHAELANDIAASNLLPALSSRIDLIDAPTTGLLDRTAANTAAITSEVTARQNADSALSTRIDNISAASGNNTFRQATAPTTGMKAGDLWFDSSAAGGNKAYRYSGSAWVATDDTRIATNAAAIETEATARANGDAAEATARQQLAARVTTAEGNISTAQSAITTEQTTRANADSAISTRIDNLVSQTIIQTYRQGTAPTGTIPTGSLWFNTNDGNKASRWSGTAWVATEDTRVASNTAAIQNEVTARTDADSALSSSISTLQTTVNGHTTSIQTQATSINGLEAKYTVKIDANGYVSGYGLASSANNGTPTSTFTVLADNFAIAKPGSGGLAPTIPFIVKTIGSTPVLSFQGYARFDRLESGTIDTQTLYVGANNLVLDGPSRAIRVNNGTTDVVKIGQISTGVYGIEIKDSAGNVILSSASGLGAGAVKASNLAAGSGVNVLYNSDFQYNVDGWVVSDNTTGGTVTIGKDVDTNNTIPGLGLAYIRTSNTPANGTFMSLAAVGQTGGKYPVVAGQRYEASAYIGHYRSSGVKLLITFYTSTGAFISNHESANVTNTTSFVRLNQLGFASVFATAPTNAVTAAVRLLVTCNGSGNQPHGMITRAYFGQAGANQTEASAWVPGATPVSTAGVSGLGSLATRNTVSATDGSVTGLGALATANNVNWNTQLVNIPAFGNFAYLSSITSANISTYIAGAAIGEAYIANAAITDAKIANVTAGKIASGTLSATTRIDAGTSVRILGDVGAIQVVDPRYNPVRERVYIGHRPNEDFGFWLWDVNGVNIFNSTGLNGTFIRDATIGRLKVLDGAINGQKIEDLSASNTAGNSAAGPVSVSIVSVGRPVNVVAAVTAGPSGSNGSLTSTVVLRRTSATAGTADVDISTVSTYSENATPSHRHVLVAVDYPPAGTHTYSVLAGTNTSVQRTTIHATECRK